MSVKIGIMWTPRKTEYLHHSLATIGDCDFTIYPDGVGLKYPFPVKLLGSKAGCFKHYYRVLKDLCETDAKFVGIMPDDMVYSRKWLDVAMEKLTDSNTGFVACYVPKGVQYRYKWNSGWHSINKGWDATWGGGYIFPIDVARKLVNHPFIIQHRDNYTKNQQIDHAIPEAIFQMGLVQWFKVPSLMNHIGIESTIGHTHRKEDVGSGWS